ncbi:hypothetical protein ACKP2L_07485 [Oenococcus alcoholitolerans]|uniref:hypothetical protein n=1 Tax=Oenococcus alcoholitolerans TaxID=931074 RepID=UPI003F7058FB
MSLLSQRQKNILLQLATRSDGLKIKDLADLTAASKRTVYRELPLIDNFLKARRIKLADHNGVYSLEGKKDELEKLLGTLYSQSSKPELTVRQRQAAIVSILLLDDQPRKILSLALRLEVSEGTIQSDLKSVEKALLNYGLQLRVKKSCWC